MTEYEFAWSDPYQAMVLVSDIPDAHPRHPGYTLLSGDVVQLYTDGTWAKVHPGNVMVGFVLSDEDVQNKLKPVWMRSAQLNFYVVGDVEASEVDPALTTVPETRDWHGYDF